MINAVEAMNKTQEQINKLYPDVFHSQLSLIEQLIVKAMKGSTFEAPSFEIQYEVNKNLMEYPKLVSDIYSTLRGQGYKAEGRTIFDKFVITISWKDVK